MNERERRYAEAIWTSRPAVQAASTPETWLPEARAVLALVDEELAAARPDGLPMTDKAMVILPEHKPPREPKHKCSPPRDGENFYDIGYPDGTLWNCPECLRWWRVYNGGFGPRWEKVRWYHFWKQRRIRQAKHGELRDRVRWV